jgi:hypothetical protein
MKTRNQEDPCSRLISGGIYQAIGFPCEEISCPRERSYLRKNQNKPKTARTYAMRQRREGGQSHLLGLVSKETAMQQR